MNKYMVDKLTNKISDLETEKSKLRNNYSEYELGQFLDNYVRLKEIDASIKTLKGMLLEEYEKGEK